MRYDVFLSFTGEEIRKTFLSHLLHSLDRKGIRSVTSATSSTSADATARQSLVAISVISKNYTSLDLWVEELAKIIACTKEVVPVFLLVDPLDVLRVFNLAENSVGTNESWRNTLETVKNWLDGHVYNKSSFNSDDWEDDSQLVDQISCFVSDTMKQESILTRFFPRLAWLTSPWAESPTLSSKLHLEDLNSLLKGSDFRLMSSSSAQASWRPMLRGSKPYENIIKSRLDESYTSLVESPTVESYTSHSPMGRFYTSPVQSPTSPDYEYHTSESYMRPGLYRSDSSLTMLVPWWRYDSFAKHNTVEEASRHDIRDMKHRVQEVLSMLRLEDSTYEVSTIGIYGMEGVGKTTLAKHVYEDISPHFQYHFFMTDFSQKGIRLLEILASETQNTTTNFSVTSDIIREIVGRKVLLVVDSADDIKQLNDFTKEIRLFGPGSRVIVITQDRSLLFQCGVKHIYEVECPGYDEAIQLFSQFAFMQTNPVSGWESISSRAVEVAGRIPLALKLLGSYLYGRDEEEWESTLDKLEESHNNYATEEVLKYIGADDFAPRTPSVLELGENEENGFPLYSFTLQ